jgi:hypothetical protein
MGIKKKINMEKIINIGDVVRFSKHKQDDILEGEVIKFFTGTDKKTYCKIKVGDKIYSKQINKL